jgi:hypothetical protein
MEILTAIQANLLSPAVLFFVLGLTAALTKSDLKFPEPLYVGLTIYLLVSIGFKGGVAIAEAGLAKVWLPALAAMVLGALIPLWTYPLLRFGGKLPGVDAAAIAAHYGSVSAVTFIAATNYLKAIDQPFENYATAFLAVMEAPAILVGVVLGKMALEKTGESSGASLRTAVHEALFGRSIFLLVGALEPVKKVLREVGAHGWTHFPVEGAGAGGERTGEMKEFANVQSAVALQPAAGHALLARVENELFQRYGMIAFESDVRVMRSGKF